MTHVLVAYASKHGSTEAIAAAIARELEAGGLRTTCAEAADVNHLEPFDAVILGSAVYGGRWRPEGRHFLRHHASALGRLPFWIFSSGPVGDPAKDNPKWQEPARTVAKAERLGVRGHVVFGGSVPADPHGFMRTMANNTPPEYQDRRDWDEIRAWAQGVAGALQVTA
jgi:menaquinone-dependent protoporphyrinogen oxidase